MTHTLTDAELARLEWLATPYANAPEWKIKDTQNICTRAVPSLVAEVRRLREKLDKEHSAWRIAEVRGDGLEMENAALRDRVEALEWAWECRDVAILMISHNRTAAFLEAVASANAAREAIS